VRAAADRAAGVSLLAPRRAGVHTWSDSQLKRHLARLEDLEYLIVHRGGRGQSFVYELFFERQEDAVRPTLPGLECEYDEKKSGFEGQKSGPSLAQVRGMSGDGSAKESPVSMQASQAIRQERAEKTLIRGRSRNHFRKVMPHRSNQHNGIDRG
jgi:hypothetical protein